MTDDPKPIQAIPFQITLEQANGSQETLIRRFLKKCRKHKLFMDTKWKNKTPKKSERKRHRAEKKNPDGWRI